MKTREQRLRDIVDESERMMTFATWLENQLDRSDLSKEAKIYLIRQTVESFKMRSLAIHTKVTRELPLPEFDGG